MANPMAKQIAANRKACKGRHIAGVLVELTDSVCGATNSSPHLRTGLSGERLTIDISTQSAKFVTHRGTRNLLKQCRLTDVQPGPRKTVKARQRPFPPSGRGFSRRPIHCTMAADGLRKDLVGNVIMIVAAQVAPGTRKGNVSIEWSNHIHIK